MIKKILKGVGFSLLLTIMGGLAFYVYIHVQINRRLEKRYTIEVSSLKIPADSLSIVRGAHLVAIKGCNDCHGDKLEGKIMSDDALFGLLVATNLTKGKGGLRRDYGTEDWIRSLKHGLNHDNSPLIFMPSHETSRLSEDDMKCLIAYLQQLPSVDNTVPETDPGFLAEILGYFDQIPLIPAEKIDHGSALAESVDMSSPTTYGRYLSVSCSGCHRDNMKGGGPLGPGMPPVPDLTSAGTTGRWTSDQFMQALRTGKRPDGRVMDSDQMPWKMTSHYTDEEITALYQYFKSIQ